MTVELNLDPLMESRSTPLLIMEVFLLLLVRVEIICSNIDSEGFKNWFIYDSYVFRYLNRFKNYDCENISTLD